MSESRTANEPARDIEWALEISREMFAAARKHDWDSLEKLRTKRDAVLKSALVTPTSHRIATALVDNVERIRDINERILSLAEEARDTRSERMRNMRLGRRASNTYYHLGR